MRVLVADDVSHPFNFAPLDLRVVDIRLAHSGPGPEFLLCLPGQAAHS